jgi:SAM-dependent methyltransferase
MNPMTDPAVRRLNWGCGMHPEPGWINSYVKEGAGIDISCDVREGLPLDDSSVDYITSIHALPELPYPDIEPALGELHRVLKPDVRIAVAPGLTEVTPEDRVLLHLTHGDSSDLLDDIGQPDPVTAGRHDLQSAAAASGFFRSGLGARMRGWRRDQSR